MILSQGVIDLKLQVITPASTREKDFSKRVARVWHYLPDNTVDFTSLPKFKQVAQLSLTNPRDVKEM